MITALSLFLFKTDQSILARYPISLISGEPTPKFRVGSLILTLKIPGPHFLLNYRVNANWHECLNGIIVYYLPSLRLPVDVYGWYRSDLSPACHQSD